MTDRRRPEREQDARTGVEEGETPNTTPPQGGERPVDEEDVFGGAERAHKGRRVESPNTKP